MVHINFLVFVVLTVIACLLGDYVVFTAFQNQLTIVKALGDSSIHGLVALFSWLIIQNEAFVHALICAAIAMMIDVDHFIQGKADFLVLIFVTCCQGMSNLYRLIFIKCSYCSIN